MAVNGVVTPFLVDSHLVVLGVRSTPVLGEAKVVMAASTIDLRSCDGPQDGRK